MSTIEHNQSSVRVATALSLTAATLCVLLRIVARRLKQQSLFADDIFILAALVAQWGIGVAGLILLENGLGSHVQDVNPGNLVTYMKVVYTGAPLYALTIVLTKISLLTLYHRLFPVKSMTYSCLVVGTLVAAWGFTTSFMGLLICSPVRKVWSPKTPGQCLDLEQFYYGLQVPNIITDVVILVLPLRLIPRLPISKRRKGLLAIVFGLGAVVVVFDIVRLVVMIELSKSGSDITWNQVATSVWTCVEPAVAISTACLPHLIPVFRWMKHYFKPEKGPQSGRESNEKIQERSATSTACMIDGTRTDDQDGRGPHDGSIDFDAHVAPSNFFDVEAGLARDVARSSIYSVSDSETHSSAGIRDDTATHQPRDTPQHQSAPPVSLPWMWRQSGRQEEWNLSEDSNVLSMALQAMKK